MRYGPRQITYQLLTITIAFVLFAGVSTRLSYADDESVTLRQVPSQQVEAYVLTRTAGESSKVYKQCRDLHLAEDLCGCLIELSTQQSGEEPANWQGLRNLPGYGQTVVTCTQ